MKLHYHLIPRMTDEDVDYVIENFVEIVKSL